MKEKINKLIIEMWNDNRSVKEITEAIIAKFNYHITPDSLKSRARYLRLNKGAPIEARPGGRPLDFNRELKPIMELYRQGHCAEGISKALGIPFTTVKGRIQKLRKDGLI